MKISILGMGAYAQGLSLVLNKESEIIMWGRDKKKTSILNKTRESEIFKNVKLPKNIKVTNDLNEVLKSELIIIALPINAVDETLNKIKDKIKDQHFCIASKGIDKNKCFSHEIFNKHIKNKNLAVIAGPSFAQDLISLTPVGLTLASKNKITQKLVKEAFKSENIILEETKDIIGTEICGVLKNIYAIIAGMLESLKFTTSTQALFLKQALEEMENIIINLNGKYKTVYSYAGIGDLLLTTTSTKSRNYSYGKLLGKNTSKKELEEYKKNTTIEGLSSLENCYKKLKENNIDAKFVNTLYEIVYLNKDKLEMINLLKNKNSFF